jgi:hypothetical protein
LGASQNKARPRTRVDDGECGGVGGEATIWRGDMPRSDEFGLVASGSQNEACRTVVPGMTVKGVTAMHSGPS